MSLYGYKNVQLITHRTHRQIADSPNAPTAPTMPKLPDSGRITGNPHLTPVSVGCCSRARVCLDRRSETQIFVDPAAFFITDPLRSLKLKLDERIGLSVLKKSAPFWAF